MTRVGRLAIVLVVALDIGAACVVMVTPAAQGLESRQPVWTGSWTPPAGEQFYPHGLARAGNGDLFVAGVSYLVRTGDPDWVVARFTADGERKWVRRHEGGSHSRIYGIAADRDGNVVAAGSVWSVTGYDWAVVCWDRRGVVRWAKRIAGSGAGNDQANDVALGPNGSFYVTGVVRRAETGDDGLTVRYGAGGKALWKRYLDGPSHGDDALRGIATDQNGNAYVAGFDFAAASSTDAVVVRYSPGGRQAWKRRWGEPGTIKEDVANDIKVRGSLIAVAGVSGEHMQASQGLTLKYDTSGKLKWVSTLANQIDATEALKWDLVGIDADGRVAVAGIEVTDHIREGAYYWATGVFDASGDLSPLQTFYGAAPGHEDTCGGLAMTATGRVYEAGVLWSGIVKQDWYVVSLSPTGVPLWDSRAPATPDTYEAGGGIVATSRAVYVAASSEGALQLLKLKP